MDERLVHFANAFEEGEYALKDGTEHFDYWNAGYVHVLSMGAPLDILLVLPALALSFDALQTALAHEHFTSEDLKSGLVGEQRKGTIIGLAKDAEKVIDGIANGTITKLGQYAEHFDLKTLKAHVLQFLTIRRSAKSPSVYEILINEYHVPEYTIPLYVAVDCGARYPAYKSMTDAKNVLTRLTGKTEHNTERYERTRTEMEAVAGYVNVLSEGRRVARIRYEAHTSHVGETWEVLAVSIDFSGIMEVATA